MHATPSANVASGTVLDGLSPVIRARPTFRTTSYRARVQFATSSAIRSFSAVIRTLRRRRRKYQIRRDRHFAGSVAICKPYGTVFKPYSPF